MKRAIVVSEFQPGATARGLLPGLRAAGWLIEEIDVHHFFRSRRSLASRLESRIRRSEWSRSLHTAIVAASDRVNAQVLLTVKGLEILPSTLRELQGRGVFTVNYYPDRDFNEMTIHQVVQYDLVVTTKSYHLEDLSLRLLPERISFLHHGYGADVFRPIGAGKLPANDVVYIGNATPWKVELLNSLLRELPDLNLRIFGQNWRRLANNTPLAAAIADESPHGDFYAAEIANAKIFLAFHMGPGRNPRYDDLVSTRSFEIPACGGFMLHIDNAEIRSLFDVPGEIDVFSSPEELAEKVRYWLANPEERAAVAARGHARAVPAYSYVERGREIAALVEDRMAKR